ncbi:sulfotransferase [Nocardioides sp. C4-1]|uniref:sulfotransferase n=1 Tax=Nocardioides sp. C4-1 TaxID=3151851 RepID=UPI00326429EB
MTPLSGLVARVRQRVVREVENRRSTPAAAQSPVPTPRSSGPRRYVLVVTYGRSGSTLVQGLLNTLPRTLVRGESNLWLLHHFRAWQKVREFRALHLRHNPRAAQSAFYGLQHVRPKAMVQSTRLLALDSLLGDEEREDVDVLGFKEVTWHRATTAEHAELADYLDRVFPGCLYVLNGRDHEHLYGSGFWKGSDRTSVDAKIRRTEQLQEHLRTSRPDRTLDVRYERLTSADPDVVDTELTAIAEFVHGSCPAELLDALRTTLRVGHGPYPFGTSRRD